MPSCNSAVWCRERLGHISKGWGAVAGADAAAHEAQADALEIEAQARHGGSVPAGNTAPAIVSDLGLTRKALHEARQLRGAEAIICVHCDKYALYAIRCGTCSNPVLVSSGRTRERP